MIKITYGTDAEKEYLESKYPAFKDAPCSGGVVVCELLPIKLLTYDAKACSTEPREVKIDISKAAAVGCISKAAAEPALPIPNTYKVTLLNAVLHYAADGYIGAERLIEIIRQIIL